MDLDLIYMNSAKEDVGIMKDFTLDLAYGDSENNFECKIVDKQHCCKEGWFLYIENTEYGGIIDDIAVNSAKGVVTYLGRTWHGILNSKIIQPDNDADYLVVSGEANSVIAMLINRIGVNSLFKAVADNSGITITSYRMHRYISGYDGIVKMLKSVNAKLNMKFNGSYIELSVKPIIDYSKDEQFDTDQIALIIKKKYKKLNHVICLGKGELSNREIIHIYADENGNIVENQVFTGLDEVATVYENVNVTGDELRKGGINKIKAAWSSDELDFKFNNNKENYDIGDIVGGSEHITGTEVAREITKKIVNISNNTVTVSYPSDTGGGGSSYSSGGSSGGGGAGGGGNVSINLNGTEETGEVYKATQPLFDEKTGKYFYPQTVASQVGMEDGTTLDAFLIKKGYARFGFTGNTDLSTTQKLDMTQIENTFDGVTLTDSQTITFNRKMTVYISGTFWLAAGATKAGGRFMSRLGVNGVNKKFSGWTLTADALSSVAVVPVFGVLMTFNAGDTLKVQMDVSAANIMRIATNSDNSCLYIYEI